MCVLQGLVRGIGFRYTGRGRYKHVLGNELMEWNLSTSMATPFAVFGGVLGFGTGPGHTDLLGDRHISANLGRYGNTICVALLRNCRSA